MSKTIKQLLEGPSFNYIFAKINQLQQLDSILTEIMPDVISQCRTANYDNHQWIIEANDACWATRIRYNESELIRALKKHKGYEKLKSIKVYVQTNTTTTA